jgi:hypothetical protein
MIPIFNSSSYWRWIYILYCAQATLSFFIAHLIGCDAIIAHFNLALGRKFNYAGVYYYAWRKRGVMINSTRGSPSKSGASFALPLCQGYQGEKEVFPIIHLIHKLRAYYGNIWPHLSLGSSAAPIL